MKRVVALLLFVLLLFSTSMTASAFDYDQKNDKLSNYIVCSNEQRIDYCDGSYCIIRTDAETIYDNYNNPINRSTVSGSKEQKYYSSDDILQWTVKVKGNFTYNGTTSSCTSASHTVTINNSSWYTYSQNSYASGNTAIANVVLKKKHLGVVVSTQNVHLVLTCDKYGNLS